MDESLTKIEARRNYWIRNPKAASSDANWMGLDYLEKDYQKLAPFNPETSKAEAFLYKQHLRAHVHKFLDKEPFIFLAGFSGVGKTTLVTKELCREGDQLFFGFEDLQDLLSAPKGGRKIWFFDEVNLAASELTRFKWIAKNRCILLNGKMHHLDPEIKLVFAGNFARTGNGRKVQTLFKDHGKTMVIPPMPTAMLYEDSIKPVFANTALEHNHLEIAHHLLEVYRFLVEECSRTDVVITPRELQMMALLTLTYCRNNPPESFLNIAKFQAYEMAKDLVPRHMQSAFDEKFKPEIGPSDEFMEEKSFSLTPSRFPMRHYMEGILALRSLRLEMQEQKNGNEAQLYGGTGLTILQGPFGTGKKAFLKSIQKAYPQVPLIEIPCDAAVETKINMIKDACNQGMGMILNNFNTAFMGIPQIESVLNSISMNKIPPHNKAPENAGSFIIAIQHPPTMAGREAVTTPLLRRARTLHFCEYSAEEMVTILCNKGLASHEAIGLIKAFQNKLQEARKKHLSPEPSFHDVIALVEKNLLKRTAAAMPAEDAHARKRVKLTTTGDSAEEKKDEEVQRHYPNSHSLFEPAPGAHDNGSNKRKFEPYLG
jgi:hypothetical protein